ncbi:hypothetical protein FJ867_11610 [Mesorhizobium sp. B2-5-3]|nr:hypothetical protein FJ867_11610 [Mesorhizobium sp. B2-5-3]
MNTPLWPAGPGPSLSLRAFVARKAKKLASRPLRGPLLTPRMGGDRQLKRCRQPAALTIGESREIVRSPPLRGRCPAGQRGVPRADPGNASL